MTCRSIRPLLAEAALGTLPAGAGADLARHIEGCAACAAELDAMRAALALVDRARPTAAAPRDVWTRLAPALDAVDAERQRLAWWRAPVIRPLRLALAGIALAAVAALALLLATGRTSRPPAAPVATAEASVDDRLAGFLRRSTPLVIALANRDEAATAEAFDGAAERRVARALARDGHALAADLRQARRARDTALVDDLIVLFMQIGNTPGERYQSRIALARHTIAREGLLFALSVQELRRAGLPPVRTGAPA